MTAIPEPASAFEEPPSKPAIEGRDPKTGQFLKGVKGVGGRKRGSRVKLAEDVVADVLESWRKEGPTVLARLACFEPGKYADFIAKVLPREVKVEYTVTDGISDDQLERMIDFAQQMAARGAVIEGHVRNVTPTAPEAQSSTAEEAPLPAVEPLKLPHPVGRTCPEPDHVIERRNIAKIREAEIDPEDLF